MNDSRLLLDRQLARRAAAREQARREKRGLASALASVADAAEAQRLVQAVAEHVQTQAHAQIAGVVTRCLRAVFEDDSYEFVIRFDRRRGRTEAKLILRRDGLELENPKDEAGGGVIDVAAFALRLACLVLAQPRLRRLLVLDEPFRFLSRDHRPKVRAMVETLAKEMGIQFVIVTHSPEFCFGKVVELGG